MRRGNALGKATGFYKKLQMVSGGLVLMVVSERGECGFGIKFEYAVVRLTKGRLFSHSLDRRAEGY